MKWKTDVRARITLSGLAKENKPTALLTSLHFLQTEWSCQPKPSAVWTRKPQPSVCRRCSQGRHRRLLLVARPESGMKVVCWRLGSKHRVFETCWGSSAFNVGQMPTSSPTRLTAVDPSILLLIPPARQAQLPTNTLLDCRWQEKETRATLLCDGSEDLKSAPPLDKPASATKSLKATVLGLLPGLYNLSSHSSHYGATDARLFLFLTLVHFFPPLRKMTFQAPINDDYYIRRWKVPVQVWGTAMTASWPAGSQLKTNSEPIGDPDWMIHQHGKHLQKNSKYTFM